MRIFRRIKRLIVNLASYTAFLIKNGDEDWDFHYLYLIMKWKINRMADHLEENSHHLYFKRDVRQLRYASLLIDRILNDHYYDELETHTCLDLGPSDVQFVPEFKRVFADAVDEADQERRDKEYTKLMFYYDAKQRKLKERLFKHMALYIERWWD